MMKKNGKNLMDEIEYLLNINYKFYLIQVFMIEIKV
jgi:hypothetical protein